MAFEVRLRPGCFRGPGPGPLISRHRSLEAAVAKARKSDRWQVETSASFTCIWAAEERRGPLGPGLYGLGPRRGEPSLAACVEQARAALRAAR